MNESTRVSVNTQTNVFARVVKQNPVLHLLQTKFEFTFLSFSSRKLHKIIKCHRKLICLMLSVYESFHQEVKYGCERNHILQDLTGLEIYISMKASKNRNPVYKNPVLTDVSFNAQMDVFYIRKIC